MIDEIEAQKEILDVMGKYRKSGKLTVDMELVLNEVLERLLKKSSKFTDVSRNEKEVNYEPSDELIEKFDGDEEKARERAKEIADKTANKLKKSIRPESLF